MPYGTIIKGIGGFYYVESPEGIYECKARGIFRKDEFTPLPGDRVEFSVTDSGSKAGSIIKIDSRKTQLVRPAIANVDQLLAVAAVRNPEPDLMLLDKLLVTAEKKGISALVCINKMDLADQSEIDMLARPYEDSGYRVVKVCSRTGEGYDEIKKALKDKVSVLAGQSGVGKSTILNNIMNMFVMMTGELSAKSERGKHTTRHAELVRLQDGGYIADTPGFSSFELENINFDELQYLYPEFNEAIGKCRFKSCSHICEPGCAVKEMVSGGSIDSGRYARYTELYNILKQNDALKYKKSNRNSQHNN